nr:30S ribosome-binding factor RbfA [Propionibacterium sp.]
MGNPRYIKVGEQIKVLVASYLERRLKDPRLGFVTVTDVRMTGDGREATVFYTVLGGEQDRADTAAALEAARGMIRSFVGKQLGMKFTPSIAFVLDAVPEAAAEIEAVLAKARDLDAEVAARAAGATYAGDADPYKKPHDDEDEPAEPAEPTEPAPGAPQA